MVVVVEEGMMVMRIVVVGRGGGEYVLFKVPYYPVV